MGLFAYGMPHFLFCLAYLSWDQRFVQCHELSITNFCDAVNIGRYYYTS